ncbi:hypothetical protein L9F63_023715, partial [Diploptera punctata]
VTVQMNAIENMGHNLLIPNGYGPKSPTYTFSSHPRALMTNRKNYRNPPIDQSPN